MFPKKVPNCHYPEHLLMIVLKIEDLKQSVKLSEMKQPLKKKSFSQCSIAVCISHMETLLWPCLNVEYRAKIIASTLTYFPNGDINK